MLVCEAMTGDVVTVAVDGTVADAAGPMLEFDVGSVVVTRGGNPYGIVTETDVIAAAHETGRPIDAIPLESATSHPLVTIGPDATVRAAVERMREAGIKKLAVVDGIDLVGILTRGDVVDAHPSLVREAVRRGERRGEWEGTSNGG